MDAHSPKNHNKLEPHDSQVTKYDIIGFHSDDHDTSHVFYSIKSSSSTSQST